MIVYHALGFCVSKCVVCVVTKLSESHIMFSCCHSPPLCSSHMFSDLLFSLLMTEPGYYEEGAFGIRIENILAVVRKEDKDVPGKLSGKTLLGFEPITMVSQAHA